MKSKKFLSIEPDFTGGGRGVRRVRTPMHFFSGVGGALVNAGAGLLAGGEPPTVVPTHSDVNIQNLLGNLPPELQGMDINQLLQALGLSQGLAGEINNAPDALSFGSLSEDVLSGGLFEGLDLAGLPSKIGAGVREGFSQSFDVFGDRLRRELGFLEESAGRQAAGATEGITGALDALGLRGSTAQGTQVANTLGGIQSGLTNAVQSGQEAAGGFAAQSAFGQAQGLQNAFALQGQLAQGIGGLLLGQRDQQIGLRRQLDSNRALLMSDPTFQNLLSLRQGTGGSQTTTDTLFKAFD